MKKVYFILFSALLLAGCSNGESTQSVSQSSNVEVSSSSQLVLWLNKSSLKISQNSLTFSIRESILFENDSQ